MALFQDPKVWLAIAFFLFMWAMFKLALPAIGKMLDGRSAKISDELNEAIRLREQAQALLAEYRQKQQKMHDEAEAMLAHAKQEADAMLAQAEKDVNALIERRTRTAEEKLSRMENLATEAVRHQIVEQTMGAVRTLATQTIDKRGAAASIHTLESDLKKLAS